MGPNHARTLYYLAMWQGLRGEELDVNLTEEACLPVPPPG
jgi:hypothetical protein